MCVAFASGKKLYKSSAGQGPRRGEEDSGPISVSPSQVTTFLGTPDEARRVGLDPNKIAVVDHRNKSTCSVRSRMTLEGGGKPF